MERARFWIRRSRPARDKSNRPPGAVSGALKRSPNDHWAQFFFWREGMAPPPPPTPRPHRNTPLSPSPGPNLPNHKGMLQALTSALVRLPFFFYRFAVHQIVELWHSSVCVSARNFPEHAHRTLGLFVGISRRGEWRVSFIALILVPSFREPIDKEL